MDDATLARLEHGNMLEWLAIAFGQVAGATIERGTGVGVFLTGLPIALFNQVVVDDGATARDLRAAVGVARGRSVPFYVVLRRGTDDELRSVVAELGVELDEGVLPGMALHPIPADIAPASALDIRRVDSAAGAQDHADAAAAGFEMPIPLVRTLIGEELWLRPGCIVYVGYAEGRAVTSGFGVRTGRTIGVYTIATTPDARGRGYGAAMTRRIVADGAADGCDVAILQSSTMGLPIYERIGFRTVHEYDSYLG